MCNDLSIRLRLPAVIMPHVEKTRSTNACELGAETISCAIKGRTEYELSPREHAD
jgi:hypothetical protein